MQSQLDPASVLHHGSAGNASNSSTSPNLASFNFGPAAVEGLYGLDGVPNDTVLQLHGPELPIYSGVQPVARRRPLRASAACGSCRKRKTKCDEDRPQCSNCRENSRTCFYKDHPAKKERNLSDVFEKLDHLEMMVIGLQNNPRSYPPYKIHCQEDDRGSYLRPLEPSYYPYRYIDGDGGREDVIEVLCPKLLPWLANYVDPSDEQTSYQPPAYFTAWQLKRSLYRYTMDPTMTFTDVAFSIMPEIDGILRAQARHNLSLLRVCNVQDILERAVFALLALHLQRSIGTLGVLADFRVKPDRFIELRTLSGSSKSIELLHLVQDDSLQFDLHFADAYPSSWFPKARESVTMPQKLDVTSDSGESHESSVSRAGDIQVGSQVVLERQKEQSNTLSADDIRRLVEAVSGTGCDPFSLISKENLWKYSLCLHRLLTASHHPLVCNPQHLSETLTSVNHCLRECLKKTLRDQAVILTDTHITEAFVQPVLDFLTLNIGTEVTSGIGERLQRGHLRNITHSADNTVTLYIQRLDNSWSNLTGPIQQVPFLWMRNHFTMKIVERGIALPPQWFFSH